MCYEELDNRDLSEKTVMKDKAVYKDMVERLRKLTPDEIDQRKIELTRTLLDAFRILRQFGFVFVFYLASSFAMIVLRLHPVVTNIGLVLMGICFLYKTYEFVCHKFCFVDAYLVMVYKMALESASD